MTSPAVKNALTVMAGRVVLGVIASGAVLAYSCHAPSTVTPPKTICWTEIKRDASLPPERIGGTLAQLEATLRQSAAGQEPKAVTDVQECQ